MPNIEPHRQLPRRLKQLMWGATPCMDKTTTPRSTPFICPFALMDTLPSRMLRTNHGKQPVDFYRPQSSDWCTDSKWTMVARVDMTLMAADQTPMGPTHTRHQL